MTLSQNIFQSFFLLIAGLALGHSVIWAENIALEETQLNAKEVTLNQLRQYLLAHNLTLQNSQYTVQAAKIERQGITGWDDPKVSLEKNLDKDFARIQVMQMLPYWNEIDSSKKIADAEKRATQFELEQMRWEQLTELSLSYYEIWLLQESLRLNQEFQKEIDHLVHLSTSEIQSFGSLPESLKAQSMASENAFESLKMAEMLLLEKVKLNTLLGRQTHELIQQVAEPSGLLTISAKPPAVKTSDSNARNLQPNHTQASTVDELVESTLRINPALQQLEFKIQQNLEQIQLAEGRKVYPNVELGLMLENDMNEVSTSVIAGVNIPFGKVKYASGLQKAFLEQKQIQLLKQIKTLEIREAVVKTWWQSDNAQKRWQFLHENLIPQARRSAEISERLYRSGQGNSATVLEMRSALFQFHLNELNAQRDYLKAKAELARFTGEFDEL